MYDFFDINNLSFKEKVKIIIQRCQPLGLCIKVGRGQGDRDIGTRVWGLGTWGRVGRDVGTSSMGRGDVWDGDAGTSNIGTRGTWGR